MMLYRNPLVLHLVGCCLAFLILQVHCQTEEATHNVKVESQEPKLEAADALELSVEEKNKQDTAVDTEQAAESKGSFSADHLYQRLFQQQRLSHKEALSSLIALGDYQKQYKMIKMLVERIFKVMSDSRVTLMENGYAPGDPIPSAESELARDAYSNIMENTAFFGDMLLRFPDITHDILNRNKEGQLVVSWSVGFCNETNIFVGNEHKLLNLMAQELGILEADPDYVNPYKKDTHDLNKILEEQAFGGSSGDSKKKKEKKKKEKKKRGPRLSGVSHTEL